MKKVSVILCFVLLLLIVGCQEEKEINHNFNIIGKIEICVEDIVSYSIDNPKDYQYVWSVSSEECANISQNGELTALKDGQIEVIATIKDTEISSLLIVTINPKEEVVTKDNYKFEIVGPDMIFANEEITYSIKETNSYEYVWQVSDTAICEINEQGVLFAYEAGIVDVIATVKGTQNSKKITVIINEPIIKPTRITLKGDDYLAVGEVFELQISLLPKDANEELIYTFDNDYISFNEETKIVEALKEGVSTITVTSLDGTVSDTFEITINSYPVNEDIKLYNGVTRSMMSYVYWSNLYSSNDDVIMDINQINSKNSLTYQTSGTKVVDITSSGATIKGSTIKNMINSYTVNTSYKINGSTQPSNYSTLLYAQTNKDNIPETIDIKFGLINSFGALRTFPTMDVATSGNNFDRFQETGVEYGEGCLIYHQSSDGNWLFVQTLNYYGWVKKEHVTIVSQKEMNDYLKSDEFIIVTSRHTTINNLNLRMSNRLVINNVNQENYDLKFITKEGFTNVNIDKENKDIHYGYLPYTRNNVLMQVFKLLGDKYRWGDCEFDGHDCSSTMNAVYNCMGFVMARNTSSQYQMPYTQYDVRSKSDAQKKEILNDLECGSLVFVSGHVMMYLGTVNGEYYIIHNFSSESGCNISTSNLIRSGSTTYLTSYTYFLEMK